MILLKSQVELAHISKFITKEGISYKIIQTIIQKCSSFLDNSEFKISSSCYYSLFI